ncbi:hypothetical protein [Caudoviricetes sp.]|nr:hypothetical protein [Caudoviricetes sp.]
MQRKNSSIAMKPKETHHELHKNKTHDTQPQKRTHQQHGRFNRRGTQATSSGMGNVRRGISDYEKPLRSLRFKRLAINTHWPHQKKRTIRQYLKIVY